MGARSASGWNARFTYTHFDTDETRIVAVPTNSGELTPILSSPYGASLTDVDRASGSAEITYDVFDVDFGHPWRGFNLVDSHEFPDDVDPPKLTRTPGDLSFSGLFARASVAF